MDLPTYRTLTARRLPRLPPSSCYRSAQAYVAGFFEPFNEFPPRQKNASFSIDQVL